MASLCFSSCRRSSVILARSVVLSGFVAISILVPTGCGVIKKKPEAEPDELALARKPLPPEQAKKLLGELGGNFVYGPSMGETAVNIGTIVVFPPYALYLLGNAVLSLSGYEPVTVSGLLPEKQGKAWSDTYDSVVGAPGRVTAAIAGKEYRTREVGLERLKNVVAEAPAAEGHARAFTTKEPPHPAKEQ